MAFRNSCKNPITIVADSDIKKIHEDTLEILENIGIKFEDEDALNLLRDHGCEVDHQRMIAKFPPAVVENCLNKVPSEFSLHARNPKYDIIFRPGNVYFAPCGAVDLVDLRTKERRWGKLKDAEAAARLTDALDNMTCVNTGILFISDVPKEVNLEWRYVTAMKNSEKIPSILVMGDSGKWGIRMAKAVGEDVLIVFSSASPLGWSKEQICSVKIAMDAGLPVGIQSMASPGTTAPATMAGTAVVMNAEILAMVVYIELLKPETGVMYSCFTIPTDMQAATLASGSIELGMLTVVSAQLSRFYGMGSMVFEPMSNSKFFDEQAGYEKAMQWLLGGMSGINLMWGAGIVESGWSNAQLIIDAEMCGMVGHYLKGIEITNETRAIDLIKDVGHFPNSYLGQRHTRDWWIKEQFRPVVSCRESYDRWIESGAKDILARADEKANEILKKHQPVPLPDEVEKELDELLSAAAQEKGVAK